MARKVALKASEAFMARKKGIFNNTVVTVDKNGNASMFLFGNRIAFHTADNRIFVTTAGWDTNTTRSRLNEVVGIRISSRASRLTLNGHEWDGRWAEVVHADPVTMVNKAEPPIID